MREGRRHSGGPDALSDGLRSGEQCYALSEVILQNSRRRSHFLRAGTDIVDRDAEILHGITMSSR